MRGDTLPLKGDLLIRQSKTQGELKQENPTSDLKCVKLSQTNGNSGKVFKAITTKHLFKREKQSTSSNIQKLD